MPITKVVVSRPPGLLKDRVQTYAADTPPVSRQVTNTVPQGEHLKQAEGKLEIMDVSPVLAESIRRVRPPLPRRLSRSHADSRIITSYTDAQRREHFPALPIDPSTAFLS